MRLSISAIDLFCGIGGLTHGLVKSGIRVNAGIDEDETCRYAFERNNRALFVHSGIEEITGDDIDKLYTEKSIKVLVGCAPCQPFSKHTQKNKHRKKDKKWGLLYHFLRLIYEVNPTVISMENVPQLAGQTVFKKFVKGLTKHKYHVSWQNVYCPDYGIPQKRMRLVLLASMLGKITLLPPTHKPGNYKSVRSAIEKLEPIRDGQVSRKDPLHRAARLSDINKKRIKQSKPGGSWLDWDESLRSPCHKKDSGRTYNAVYSRMEWDNPAPTITTQFYSFGTGRFGHPVQNRALSLREGALLQTFPKCYNFFDNKTGINYKRVGIHIGNAVPVRLGYMIGQSILKHLGGDINVT